MEGWTEERMEGEREEEKKAGRKEGHLFLTKGL